jgi:hypothetical protein
MGMNYYIAHQDLEGKRQYMNTYGVFVDKLYQDSDDGTLILNDVNVALTIAEANDALVMTESDYGLIPV